MLLDSNRGLVGRGGSVGGLVVGGRGVVEIAVQPVGVPPVHPSERREFDLVDRAASSSASAARRISAASASAASVVALVARPSSVDSCFVLLSVRASMFQDRRE